MRPKEETPKPKLRRALGLFETTLYGVGIILGAGIYALIGEAAGIAGNMVWLAFAISAVIAAFTALSYAELGSLFAKAAAEFVYVKNAFRSRLLAFIIGYTTVLVGIITAATVSLGFGGYFISLFGGSIVPIAILVVLAFSALNFIGIRESMRLNVIFTLVETGGLILIIILGASFLGGVNYFETPPAAEQGFLSPITVAVALIFFAFIGFEDVVNIAEETRQPKKTIPRALLLALGISTVIYMLVSLVAVSVVPYTELAESSAPLALVADRATGGGWGWLLSIIALFSTANTILISLIVASRMLYGLGEEGVLPKMISVVHSKTRTPYLAIIVTFLAAVFFLSIGDISTVAFLSDFAIFTLFFFVNASVIALRYVMPGEKRGFRVPFNIGKFPLLPLFGCLSSLYMLTQFFAPMELMGLEFPVIFFGLAMVLAAVPIYFLFNRGK